MLPGEITIPSDFTYTMDFFVAFCYNWLSSRDSLRWVQFDFISRSASHNMISKQFFRNMLTQGQEKDR